MRNIAYGTLSHMATYAIVLAGHAGRPGCGTRILLVAFLASAQISCFIHSGMWCMRIVAGCTRQLPRLETGGKPQPFGLGGNTKGRAAWVSLNQKHMKRITQGLTRPEIRLLTAWHLNALQMALATNVELPVYRKPLGVNDRIIGFASNVYHFIPLHACHVFGTRSVAPFTIYCRGQLPVAIEALGFRLAIGCMAVQTFGCDRSVKTAVVTVLVPWTQIPALFLGIPGKRCLVQKAITFQQIGACLVSGTDDVVDPFTPHMNGVSVIQPELGDEQRIAEPMGEITEV
jgi:hypothetical protein